MLLGYISLKYGLRKKKQPLDNESRDPQLFPTSVMWSRASHSLLLGLSFPPTEGGVELLGLFRLRHFVSKYHTVPFLGNQELGSTQAIYKADQ